MKTIEIQSVEQVEDVLVAKVAVKDGTTELFGRAFRARSKSELDATLLNLLNEVNRIPDEISKVTVGEWTPPTPPEPEPPKEKTAEELKQEAISAKEQALAEAVEEAKRKREIEELALTDANVATKLAELEGAKTTTKK
jgi:hypothetical protein